MTTSHRQKVIAHLQATNERYLTAEAKLREAIIAARTETLDGEPALTYRQIGEAIGISAQAVQQYIRRWTFGAR